MNKAIAHILKVALGGTPMVDKLAGLVQVQEYENTTYDDSGTVPTTSIIRIPVSCDVEAGACDQNDLVPDSSKKGILYFEDNGVTPLGSVGPYYKYASRLRLVCWINTKGITNNVCYDVAAMLITGIQKTLNNLNATNSGNFLKLEISLEAIPKQDKGIFSQYTYDLFNTQYLMHPFEYFAMDLNISYQIHPLCIEQLNFVAPENNC